MFTRLSGDNDVKLTSAFSMPIAEPKAKAPRNILRKSKSALRNAIPSKPPEFAVA